MWITLELCALTVLHSSGALGATAAIVLAIILLILLIADMACYLAYCHLPPMPAFIDGTVAAVREAPALIRDRLLAFLPSKKEKK